MLVFKEWAYVVEALASGRQTIILRKGGIAEEEGDFNLRRNEFLLMPTAYHQAAALIKTDWYNQVKDTVYIPDQLTTIITYRAKVSNYQLITSEDEVMALDSLHVWNNDVVLERFNRWKNNQVHCLYVAIERLEQPIVLEMKPEYGGCKSWIEI